MRTRTRGNISKSPHRVTVEGKIRIPGVPNTKRGVFQGILSSLRMPRVSPIVACGEPFLHSSPQAWEGVGLPTHSPTHFTGPCLSWLCPPSAHLHSSPHFSLTHGTLSPPAVPTTICSCPQTTHHPCLTTASPALGWSPQDLVWTTSSNVPRITHRTLSDPLSTVRGDLYRSILIPLLVTVLPLHHLYLWTLQKNSRQLQKL